jgi:hypothetical protein
MQYDVSVSSYWLYQLKLIYYANQIKLEISAELWKHRRFTMVQQHLSKKILKIQMVPYTTESLLWINPRQTFIVHTILHFLVKQMCKGMYSAKRRRLKSWDASVGARTRDFVCVLQESTSSFCIDAQKQAWNGVWPAETVGNLILAP